MDDRHFLKMEKEVCETGEVPVSTLHLADALALLILLIFINTLVLHVPPSIHSSVRSSVCPSVRTSTGVY